MAERHWFECGREQGIFAQMMVGLAAEHVEKKTIMIDATYLKAHRTATSMGAKKGGRRQIGKTKGGMNTKAWTSSRNRSVDNDDKIKRHPSTNCRTSF